MRAEADERKTGCAGIAVDQNEIGPDVAVAVIVPLAAERVIEIPPGQRPVFRQHGQMLAAIGRYSAIASSRCSSQ
jgi:hypothetical protein